jgi:hypothetical protein
MGYYYNWVDAKWVEKPLIAPKPPRRAVPRRTLVTALMEEMSKGDSEARLYAELLARKLIVGDEGLMKEFGKTVAEMTGVFPRRDEVTPGSLP